MASTPGFEPGPHWWEASALTSAPPLLTMLEKVQRRAYKCALENFGRDLSKKERLMVTKWSTLQQRLFSSLTDCYKTINSLNGLDTSKFFTFSSDFRPLRANHRFKLKSVSATLNSFKHFFLFA